MGDHHHAHQHAHGPANRGRIVLTTAAPLFVCPPTSPVRGALVALHAGTGIDDEFEAGLRLVACRGLLVVAPYAYYRDGGPHHPPGPSADTAYARLRDADLDADVDAAVDHLTSRIGLPAAAICCLGAGSGAVPAARAAERHPFAATVVLDPPPAGAGPTGSHPEPVASWSAAADLLSEALDRRPLPQRAAARPGAGPG
jgi:dienelactone hydrolase